MPSRVPQADVLRSPPSVSRRAVTSGSPASVGRRRTSRAAATLHPVAAARLVVSPWRQPIAGTLRWTLHSGSTPSRERRVDRLACASKVNKSRAANAVPPGVVARLALRNAGPMPDGAVAAAVDECTTSWPATSFAPGRLGVRCEHDSRSTSGADAMAPSVAVRHPPRTSRPSNRGLRDARASHALHAVWGGVQAGRHGPRSELLGSRAEAHRRLIRSSAERRLPLGGAIWHRLAAGSRECGQERCRMDLCRHTASRAMPFRSRSACLR